MHDYLLGTTELGNVALAHVGGKDSIDSFSELIGVVREKCGDPVAGLFAEPVRNPARPGKPALVTWYAAFEGSTVPLSQLDPADKARATALLRDRLARFASLFVGPASGPVFASWLYILDPKDVVSIAGQPVLTNWGMVPACTGEASASREAHFRRVLGGVLPDDAPAPPFSDPEAAVFATRLAHAQDNSEPGAAAPATSVKAAAAKSSAAEAAPLAPPLSRPWLAPLIAVATAALVLAVIDLFHLLRYPDAPIAQSFADRVDLQRQTNQALAERLAQLKQAAGNVCLAPNTQGEQKLLPVAPEKTTVPVAPRQGQSQPGASSLADLIDKATVLVVNGNSSGSGFFISERNIVTNHHVVGDASGVMVGNRALGGFVKARVAAVGAGRERGTQDVAVLEIESGSAVPALRIGVTPGRLRPVLAAGFPGAVISTIDLGRTDQLPEANISAGIVTSRQFQKPDGVGAIIHTAQIGPGNSGGPLVDEGACAVGVNSWFSFDSDQTQNFQTYNESLDAEELRKFLDSHDISYVKADAECAPLAPPKPESPAPRPETPAPRPATGPN